MSKAKSPQSNLIDIKAIRFNQNFLDETGVEKKLLHVPVRKPNKQEFIRVHPSEEYRVQVGLIELKEKERENYLVCPSIRAHAEQNLVHAQLFTAVNRQGTVFLWPCKMPKSEGRPLQWHLTALAAAEEATGSWVKIVANMNLGAYETFLAMGELGDPVWPTLNLQELINIAFHDRFIDDINHSILRQLRGEI
jgi:hypothetical protein